MRRFAASILLLLIMVSVVFAVAGDTDSETFMIKAFKNKFDGTARIYINDRISKQNVIEAERLGTPKLGDISIDSVVDDVLGSAANITDPYVVFSYRVEGSGGGSYTVNFKFSEFQNNNGNTIATDYQIGQLNSVFASEAGYTQSNEQGDWRIKQEIVSGRETGKDLAAIISFEDISTSWGRPDDNEGDWIARGAIGMVVDNESYSNAPNGVYKATVTVTLSNEG